MRRFVAALTGLALLTAAWWVAGRTPDDYDHRYAPLATEGRVGAPVRAGGFVVRVDRVTAARSATPDGDELVRPDGVFLIVTVSAMSRRAPLILSTALLRTRDGNVYRDSVKNIIANDGDPFEMTTLAPSVWTRGAYVFEVPPSELAGATFVVSDRPANEKDPPKDFPAFGFELTAEADIPLGLTEAGARRLVAGAPERATIPGTTT
ncbi:DUF4352 domain-containing protein [Actinoallomurus spadix]|uniref:DUF4352 domain-containing protein n=1 Tax=Actinoallomurus spadix TaxID=79912 RepID=A0ABN0XJ90_9ACTN|nr:DUF4352 domain-containing protein [Actinoallomurus spadix]MCO5984911.1 DUF4352 domain-containing protein [Actinoallomurus spadix]